MRKPRTFVPLYVLAAVVIAVGAVSGLGLRPNLTPSLPRGVYRLSTEPVERGRLVAVCLPRPVAELGRERGYLPPGSCPGGAAPALKRVVAVGGDLVEVRSSGLWIGGERVQGPAADLDRQGRPLEKFPAGNFLLTTGELWLAAPAEHSWDSRYYGPVPASRVLGTVEPVWTVGEVVP